MNVMLVSVTERTREIGVRVAVGATDEAIQRQFLGEAVMLSLVGGAAGVLLGLVGSVFVGRTLQWPMQLSVDAIVAAASFSVTVGVFFGYYPARKASRLDPIESLRYE
jgi:putative ABC transport system permease protein